MIKYPPPVAGPFGRPFDPKFPLRTQDQRVPGFTQYFLDAVGRSINLGATHYRPYQGHHRGCQTWRTGRRFHVRRLGDRSLRQCLPWWFQTEEPWRRRLAGEPSLEQWCCFLYLTRPYPCLPTQPATVALDTGIGGDGGESNSPSRRPHERMYYKLVRRFVSRQRRLPPTESPADQPICL